MRRGIRDNLSTSFSSDSQLDWYSLLDLFCGMGLISICWLASQQCGGLGSVGLPLGIFGTTRLEKNLSRHIGHFISLCFSDMVIYAIYRLAVLPVDAPCASAHSSPSPPPKPSLTLGLWEFIFGAITVLVTALSTW